MTRLLIPLAALVLTVVSCGQRAPAIEFGRTECAHCRMNVVDKRFGAALVTAKGRQYAFDDIACMVHFVDRGTVAEAQVAAWYVCDHARPGELIDATTALYLHGPGYRSPMRGDVAAFSSAGARQRAMATQPGDTLDWEGVRTFLRQ